MVFSLTGRIYYASQSITSLLGYFPSDLTNSSIYEIVYQEDHTLLYNVLSKRVEAQDLRNSNKSKF